MIRSNVTRLDKEFDDSNQALFGPICSQLLKRLQQNLEKTYGKKHLQKYKMTFESLGIFSEERVKLLQRDTLNESFWDSASCFCFLENL